MSNYNTPNGVVALWRLSAPSIGWKYEAWPHGAQTAAASGLAESRSDALVLGGEALGMAVALKNTMAGHLRKAIEDFDAKKTYGTIGPVDN